MIELSIDPLPRRESKSVRILDMIEGRNGMRFQQIQEELWRMTHGATPFDKKNLRGYWCTGLYGGMHYGPGLLNFFCEKLGRKWVRKLGVPHNGRPWKTMEDSMRNTKP